MFIPLIFQKCQQKSEHILEFFPPLAKFIGVDEKVEIKVILVAFKCAMGVKWLLKVILISKTILDLAFKKRPTKI